MPKRTVEQSFDAWWAKELVGALEYGLARPGVDLKKLVHDYARIAHGRGYRIGQERAARKGKS